eukprot:UN01254
MWTNTYLNIVLSLHCKVYVALFVSLSTIGVALIVVITHIVELQTGPLLHPHRIICTFGTTAVGIASVTLFAMWMRLFPAETLFFPIKWTTKRICNTDLAARINAIDAAF